MRTAAIVVLAVMAGACQGSEPRLALYTASDLGAMRLAQSYSLAALLEQDESKEAHDLWFWTRYHSVLLGVGAPERGCDMALSRCVVRERDRIGAELRQLYGARTRAVFDIGVDTALLGLALVYEDFYVGRSYCNHMLERSADSLLTEQPWRALCSMPFPSEFDDVLAQLIASRDMLMTWLRDHLAPSSEDLHALAAEPRADAPPANRVVSNP